MTCCTGIACPILQGSMKQHFGHKTEIIQGYSMLILAEPVSFCTFGCHSDEVHANATPNHECTGKIPTQCVWSCGCQVSPMKSVLQDLKPVSQG